jgi:hypothetical protein
MRMNDNIFADREGCRYCRGNKVAVRGWRLGVGPLRSKVGPPDVAPEGWVRVIYLLVIYSSSSCEHESSRQAEESFPELLMGFNAYGFCDPDISHFLSKVSDNCDKYHP